MNDNSRACVINPKNFPCINLAIGSLKYRQAANVARLMRRAEKPVKKIQNASKCSCCCVNVQNIYMLFKTYHLDDISILFCLVEVILQQPGNKLG
jgi:hypothetical protein